MSDMKLCEPEQQSLYLNPTRHSNPVSYPTSHWLVLSPPKGQRVDGVQVGDDWRFLHLHSPWQRSLHLSNRTLAYVAPNSVISHVVSHPGLQSQPEPFRCHMSLCQHIPWFVTHRKWGLCSFCGVISRMMGSVRGVVTQSNTFHELEDKKSVGSLSSCLRLKRKALTLLIKLLNKSPYAYFLKKLRSQRRDRLQKIPIVDADGRYLFTLLHKLASFLRRVHFKASWYEGCSQGLPSKIFRFWLILKQHYMHCIPKCIATHILWHIYYDK